MAIKKILLSVLGEKRYLSFLASAFQRLYPTGLLGSNYQDIYFLKELIEEGSCCADIGAHRGYYTFEFSRLVKASGKVLAIEPMSKFHRALQALLQAKGIKNVDLYQLALGGEGEWVEMGIPRVDNMKKFAYARVMKSSEHLDYIESEK